MKKKKTIGNNPLAVYLGATSTPEQKKNNKTIDKTQRVTMHMSTELINAVKDAVFWEPGLTLTAFAHEAFSVALQKIEKKRGKKYPKRKDHNLRGGRPLK